MSIPNNRTMRSIGRTTNTITGPAKAVTPKSHNKRMNIVEKSCTSASFLRSSRYANQPTDALHIRSPQEGMREQGYFGPRVHPNANIMVCYVASILLSLHRFFHVLCGDAELACRLHFWDPVLICSGSFFSPSLSLRSALHSTVKGKCTRILYGKIVRPPQISRKKRLILEWGQASLFLPPQHRQVQTW